MSETQKRRELLCRLSNLKDSLRDLKKFWCIPDKSNEEVETYLLSQLEYWRELSRSKAASAEFHLCRGAHWVMHTSAVYAHS